MDRDPLWVEAARALAAPRRAARSPRRRLGELASLIPPYAGIGLLDNLLGGVFGGLAQALESALAFV